LALVLNGENVVNIWKEMAGPENPAVAKELYPNSIRSLFGIDEFRNAVHCSETTERALGEVNIFFPHTLERGNSVVADTRLGTSSNPFPIGHRPSVQDLHATLERTLALIKPDAYATGKKDSIVGRIQDEGFKIVKESEVQLSLAQAQQFYIEHQSKPFYEELVNWMSG
jgi:nucleoside diphosphate kinase